MMQNAPAQVLDLPGLTSSPLEISSGAARFDLTLAMEETAAGLRGAIEYNSDLFDSAAVERFSAHFQTLCASIVAEPARRISRLSFLRETERNRLISDWDRSDPYEVDCFHRLFEARAQRMPHAPAIQTIPADAPLEEIRDHEGETLTYRALNERANRLAHLLRARGVSRETPVGLLVERSPAMVVALLAVLKAGGAYVPLDPGFPRERLTFMIKDSGAALLLTRADLAVDPLSVEIPTLYLEDELETGFSAENPAWSDKTDRGDELAYTIYTSGSTGRPKGVQITHRSLTNLLSAMAEITGLTERDLFLAVTTISFDIAGLELYLPLILGARLVLADAGSAADPSRLVALLDRFHITAMQATPASWRLLLASGWRPEPRLKMLCGGEALSSDLARRLLAGGNTLWNLYGPTETTIWSTTARLDARIPTSGPEAALAIGRPIRRTAVYLFDEYSRELPVGVAGELLLGGAGLARGYRGRPGLTAARFTPNPFPIKPGERLYRTGDRARFRAGEDGSIATIEFLGRLDHQLKLRGFRIEPGEIETVLERHPRVRGSVVVIRDDRSGGSLSSDARLVAYVLTNEEEARTGNLELELRKLLKQALPAYMVPSLLIPLAAFPLTPNGKLDRAALPAPSGLRPELENNWTPPESETEHKIASIWREALKIERVGIHDSFFDLGGHSLLLIQVHARLKAVLGRDVSMVELFQYPTVHGLAAHLEHGDEEGSGGNSRDRVLNRKSRADGLKRQREKKRRRRQKMAPVGENHE